MARRTEQLTVGRRHVTVSNLDKVLYPGTRFTKAKVIDYYVNISKYLLPHLKEHPVTYELIEGNYYKGVLRFYLNGTKLKGEWTMKRFAEGRDERDTRDKWHLIKTGKNARAVSKKRDDQSALTNRTMIEIGSAADAVWQSNDDEDRSATTAKSATRFHQADAREACGATAGRFELDLRAETRWLSHARSEAT